MTADERLAKLFERGNINFSIETINTKLGPQALITITRLNSDNTQESVGGTYMGIEEGINDCIDKLDRMARERIGLKVVKSEDKEILLTADPEE